MRLGGLETEEDYPYTGRGGACQFDGSKVLTLGYFREVRQGSLLDNSIKYVPQSLLDLLLFVESIPEESCL